MERPSHALLRSSITKKNTKSRQSSMPDRKGVDVSYSTSCIGRATPTRMTHGFHTPTCMQKSCWRTFDFRIPLWLGDWVYKTTFTTLKTLIFSSSLQENK